MKKSDCRDWMRNHDRKRIGADTAAAWTACDRKFGLVWLWVVVLVVVFVLGLLNLLIGWLINLNWVVVVVVGLYLILSLDYLKKNLTDFVFF